MRKMIKSFKTLSKVIQRDLYNMYAESGLERTVFPYKGALEEGVIYKSGDFMYLVPITSIAEIKSKSGQKDDDYSDDYSGDYSDYEGKEFEKDY